jgi:dTDP-4-dehydrorhamnose 3,5-epimerase
MISGYWFMKFNATPLKGCYEIELTRFSDERGWFGRFYCKDEFTEIGHSKEWVQMNHSFTKVKGSLRGVHFQVAPFSEIKLVRCIAGAAYDVVVDLRKGSETFLQWHSVKLSAEKMNMVYIPEGFAHGFQTLAENTELIYLHSEYYRPEAEGGLKYDDPRLGINWPCEVVQISERDKNLNTLDESFNGL